MQRNIVEFADVLRRSGVRVSTSEVIDATRATALLGTQNRELCRSALQVCLVKRAADTEIFLKLFDAYFTGRFQMLALIDGSILKAIEEDGFLEGDQLEMILATLDRLMPRLNPLSQAVMSGRREAMVALMRGAFLQVDFKGLYQAQQLGFYRRRLLKQLGLDALENDFNDFIQTLREQSFSSRGLELIGTKLSKAVQQIEKEVGDVVAQQLGSPAKSDIARPWIDRLSVGELKVVQEAVKKIAERIKSRQSARRRPSRRGILNPRKTLRRNLTCGGVPMVPVFHRRRINRPEIIVLCDLSESVRNTSWMMLIFMHTLQSLFRRVRCFAFVSGLEDVSDLLKVRNLESAIDLSVLGNRVSLTSNSNYGLAFRQFIQRFSGEVGRHSTVLVIGDGRSNHHASGRAALKDLKTKAKRLYWICTEERESWGIGDSEMLGYSQICHQVVTVQTVADFARVAHLLKPA